MVDEMEEVVCSEPPLMRFGKCLPFVSQFWCKSSLQDNSDLKEIEMEDLVIETAPDIDSCDSNNPLAVVEYVEDIYSFYRQTEVNIYK